MLFSLIFHQATIQGWQRCRATIFQVNNNQLTFFQSRQKNLGTIDWWQRSQHVTWSTLAHYASWRTQCIGILMTRNERFHIILTDSLAAMVLIQFIFIYMVHICNGFLCKISSYNKMQYKCEFKMQFFYQLYCTRNASSKSEQSDTILGLDHVYVVYLIENERGGCNYGSCWCMAICLAIRKIPSNCQWHFQ